MYRSSSSSVTNVPYSQEQRTKQVVMGKLTVHDSFGEISVISKEPISCSIVTATPVELAVIEPEKLEDLDDTTVQLLKQSSEQPFANLTLVTLECFNNLH